MNKSNRKGHMSVHRNKRVLVHMRGQPSFMDTFMEGNDRYVKFKDRGQVSARHIRTLSIIKEQIY